ncbi:MAG TPA: hypothetical protein PKO06_18950, partial [Candidatus Ozemobacteraceae bacterium]|nr:hypothetical protein [Candidatus Ozemobacteraceae bacterium]
QGLLTHEKWMQLNPPAGKYWVIKDGAIETADKPNTPITEGNTTPAGNTSAPAGTTPANSGTTTPSTPKPEPKPEVKPEPAKPVDEYIKLFQADLKNMGIKDISGMKDSAYYNALNKARGLVAGSWWQSNPMDKFLMNDYKNIWSLQKQLLDAHKTYQEVWEKRRTSKILGIFGNDIESAGKRVDQLKARLQEAWNEFLPVYDKAKAAAEEAKKNVSAKQEEIKKLEADFAKLGRDPSKAAEVDRIATAIENARDQIKDDEAKVQQFEPMKALFGR